MSEGHPLSYWVGTLDTTHAGNGVTWSSMPPQKEKHVIALKAIRAVGTNAIPFLLRDLEATNSAFSIEKKRVLDAIYKLTHFNGAGRFQSVSPAEIKRWQAAVALESLGDEVAEIIPILESVLARPDGSSGCAKEAAFILANMGPRGVSVVTNAAVGSNEWAGICAFWSIGQHPSLATNLVPFLLQTATHTNQFYSYGSVWALGIAHTDPGRVVPLLTSLLQDSNSNIRSFAAKALGEFGAAAQMAVPALKELTTDSTTSWNATEALKLIEKGVSSADHSSAEEKPAAP